MMRSDEIKKIGSKCSDMEVNKAYDAAFDEECRKAGFASAADFSTTMRRR
jgi:hypothetical protein